MTQPRTKTRTPKPRVYTVSVESDLPVMVCVPGIAGGEHGEHGVHGGRGDVVVRVSEAEARVLVRDLTTVLGELSEHFQCKWRVKGVRLEREWRCPSRGTVKDPAGEYLCGVHARVRAREAKVRV